MKGSYRHLLFQHGTKQAAVVTLKSALAGILMFFTVAAYSASLPVPNGDFTAAGNFGAIGGGVGSGSASIGTGPWSGSYQGILGLLAPPTLSITSGKATITGLLGVNAVGVVNNGGYFFVNSTTPYAPNRRYTVGVDVDAGRVLDVGILTSGNAGIAITRAGTRLASSAISSNVTLALLSGNSYRLQLTYETAGAVSGNIGVDLFAEPGALLTAALAQSVSFSNVTLDNRLINQVPAATVGVSSGPFNPVVGTVLAGPLSVKVLDAQGDPIAGIPVTWTAPTTGPSATLSPTVTVTDASGIGSVTATANTIAGSYQITATVSGVTPSTTFDMTNVAGTPANVSVLIGPVQQAQVNQPFALPLKVKITDSFGNPNQGVMASFSAPSAGASAILSTTSVQTATDGTAQVTATANGIAGIYAITAQVNGTSASASFSFTNLLPSTTMPGQVGEPEQHADVNQAFVCSLVVRVTDQGSPVPGLAVDFTAPGSGPSSLLQNGTATGLSLRVLTDVDGLAWVNPIANGIAGQYSVIAQLVFSTSAPITFTMKNLAAGDSQFFTGFDGACIASGTLDELATQ